MPTPPDPLPRARKESAIVALTDIRNEIDGGAAGVGRRRRAVKEVEHAIEHVRASLDGTFWVDAERLDPHRGRHVFNEEKHAAQDIFDSIDEGEIDSEDLIRRLLDVVDELAEADRDLAARAILDAAGGDPKELAEAGEYLDEGDALREKAESAPFEKKDNLIYEAMDHAYRHAWKAAIDAVED